MSIDAQLGSLRNLPTSERSAEELRARLTRRRRRRRRGLGAGAALISIAVLIAAVLVRADDDVTIETAASEPAATALAPGAIIALTSDSELVLLDPRGELQRTIANLGPLVGSGGLAVSPDGRSIYIGARTAEASTASSNCTGEVRRVDARGGTWDVVATQADSPALSADGSRLAYASLERINDICYRGALVVMDLASGTTESYPYPTPGVPDGTPPELPISWSPDGTSIASVENTGATLLELSTGEHSPVTSPGRPLLPTFVEQDRLAVLVGCCVGEQSVQIVDLRSGESQPWLTIDVPLVSLAVGADLSGMAVTADDTLVALREGGAIDVLADGYRQVARRPDTEGAENEEEPDGSGGPCEGVDLRVPAPSVLTSVGSEELDLLFINHRCGYSADGIAFLGGEPKVIVVGDIARLDVELRFDVTYSLTGAAGRRVDMVGRRDDDGLITVGSRVDPCMELSVYLIDGGLTGGFTARLATTEGDCG